VGSLEDKNECMILQRISDCALNVSTFPNCKSINKGLKPHVAQSIVKLLSCAKTILSTVTNENSSLSIFYA